MLASINKCNAKILYAKYTKHKTIARPTVVKYSDLVTSRVEKSIQEVW